MNDIEVQHSPNYSPEPPATYSGGAMRSGRLPAYRLIPKSALRVEAEAFAEGNRKYERAADGTRTGVTSNWRRGDLDFFLDAGDHLMAHVAEFNNLLLEFMLDYQNPGLSHNGDHFEIKKAKLLEELGHARANTAFLAEWLDSGAAGIQIVQEIARIEQAEWDHRNPPTIENDPPRDAVIDSLQVIGELLEGQAVTQDSGKLKAMTPEEAVQVLRGSLEEPEPSAPKEPKLLRSLTDVLDRWVR